MLFFRCLGSVLISSLAFPYCRFMNPALGAFRIGAQFFRGMLRSLFLASSEPPLQLIPMSFLLLKWFLYFCLSVCVSFGFACMYGVLLGMLVSKYEFRWYGRLPIRL